MQYRETFRDQKARDLYDVVNRIQKDAVRSGLKLNREFITRAAINSPAPRFYVSTASAMKYLSDIESGRRDSYKMQHRTDMWMEIRDRVNKMMSEYCGARSKRDIVEQVLSSEAPQFYITFSAARNLISYYLNDLIKKERR